MLVRRNDFQEIVTKLSAPGIYGLDTETTGLARKDRIFSVIFADADDGYYFNFNDKPDHLGRKAPDEYILPREWIEELAPITENSASLFFLHNAKFDISMLSRDGLNLLGTAHCTEAMERVLKNNYFGSKPYSLKSCAARRELSKDESVEAYIKEHGLITKLAIPGKKKLVELKHFDLVPFDIIAPYGCTDAIITRAIGLDQLTKIKEEDEKLPVSLPRRQGVIENERKFTKALWRMEEAGVKIDRPYTESALAWTTEEAQRERIKFQEQFGMEFKDGSSELKKIFSTLGVEMPLTPTGKMRTNKEALDNLDHPVGKQIRAIRRLEKLCGTYYSSFLHFADGDDRIHANVRQGGTETSRLSYSDPNLQNLPKEDKESDRLKEMFSPTQ